MRSRPDELLLPEEVSALLDLAPTVLREMRKTRSGIGFIAFTPRSHARYNLHDVIAWFHGVHHRLLAEVDARNAAQQRQRLRLVVSKKTPPARGHRGRRDSERRG